jgi:hypothetical protein
MKSHDLTTALKDSYLRRVALGPGGEPAELGFHRMRLVLEPGAPEVDRVVGLRFRGVVALASQAHRFDVDDETWLPDPADWLSGLAHEDAMPPIVSSAVVGSGETLERMQAAAEDLLWRVGSSGGITVNCQRAPVLFELAAEGVLLSGSQGRLRLFIAARELVVQDRSGRSTLERIVNQGDVFMDAWRVYWKDRRTGSQRSDDLGFEWLQP